MKNQNMNCFWYKNWHLFLIKMQKSLKKACFFDIMIAITTSVVIKKQGVNMKALLTKAIVIVAIGLTLFGLYTLNYGVLKIGF